MKIAEGVTKGMLRAAAALTLGCTVLAQPSVSFAEAPSAIIDHVETQRHLAMIEANISTFDAQNLSLIGAMTYFHRTCGDVVVSQHDIDSVSRLVRSIRINEQIRDKQTSAYVDAMSLALTNISPAEKAEMCQKAKDEYDGLKRDWGIK